MTPCSLHERSPEVDAWGANTIPIEKSRVLCLIVHGGYRPNTPIAGRTSSQAGWAMALEMGCSLSGFDCASPCPPSNSPIAALPLNVSQVRPVWLLPPILVRRQRSTIRGWSRETKRAPNRPRRTPAGWAWYHFGTGCIVRSVQIVPPRGRWGRAGRPGTHRAPTSPGWGPSGRWFKSRRPDSQARAWHARIRHAAPRTTPQDAART